jgi:hypothetical protein
VHSGRALVLAAAALVCAAIGFTLAATVPDTSEVPLVPYVPGMQPLAVELPPPTQHYEYGPEPHRLLLAATDANSLTQHPAIKLLMADYGTGAEIESATLLFGDGGCRFVAQSWGFVNNDYLTFFRDHSCEASVEGEPIDLRIDLKRPARIAVWTWTQPAWMPAIGELTVNDRRALRSERPAINGFVVDTFPPSGTRRVAVLALLWSTTRARILADVTALAILFVAGVMLTPIDSIRPGSRTLDILRMTVGAGLTAFSISAAFALFVPPFQAPDEPSHFLGVVSRLGVRTVDVEDWAMRDHFERLRSDARARFRPPDATRRLPGSWRDVSPTDFSRRSTAASIWRAALRVADGPSIPSMLLLLRIVNAAVFGTAVALGVGLVAASTDVARPQLLVVPLLICPTVPFFGMHVSNYAILTAAYALIASGFAAGFLGGERADWAGLALGAGTAVALATSRNAIPLLPFVAAAAVARTWTRPPGSSQRIVRFWAGCATAAAGLPLAFSSYVPAQTIASTRFGFWPGVVAIGAACGAACLLEVLRAKRQGPSRPALSRWMVVGPWLLAASAVGSVLFTFPQLPSVPLDDRPPMPRYVMDTLFSAMTMTRLRHHDRLLSASFWGGYGWLERMLPEWWITIFVSATAVAAAILMRRLWRDLDEPRAKALAIMFCGGVISLALYAAGSLAYSPDLHGRYLVGLFVAALAIVWTPLLRQRSTWWTTGALTLVAVSYGAALCFVITRYY